MLDPPKFARLKSKYYVVFAPATPTVKVGRRQHTTGGSAILIAYYIHRYIPKGITYTGCNWAACTIRLRGQVLLNLITSYIVHGQHIRNTQTLSEIHQFTTQFSLPYIWGGTLIGAQKSSLMKMLGS